jgi:hypothetical protein
MWFRALDTDIRRSFRRFGSRPSVILQAFPSGEAITPAENTKLYPQERWGMGITTSAEVWNGRLAMLGILGLIAELMVGQRTTPMIGLL